MHEPTSPALVPPPSAPFPETEPFDSNRVRRVAPGNLRITLHFPLPPSRFTEDKYLKSPWIPRKTSIPHLFPLSPSAAQLHSAKQGSRTRGATTWNGPNGPPGPKGNSGPASPKSASQTTASCRSEVSRSQLRSASLKTNIFSCVWAGSPSSSAPKPGWFCSSHDKSLPFMSEIANDNVARSS
jgi:hypothetical protein